MQQFIRSTGNFNGIFFASIALIYLYACNAKANNDQSAVMAAPSLPVMEIRQAPATTYQEFTASLEGSSDIEIRPQVDGYIEKILVDEGAYVKKGQAIFVINNRPYNEQLNNANASLAAATANLNNASINVSKLEPLVASNIVSEIQLKTAKSSRDAAQAMVSQARAQREQAAINMGYTIVKAPADGYIGRIPYKTGSLAGSANPVPLTVISSVKELHAYFSLSDKDFLQFEEQYKGATLAEKIKQIPPVELLLANNTVYAQKGKIELVNGLFNNQSGTISFMASFPNKEGLLRSGSTGKIIIPTSHADKMLVPAEATFELQDKVFVFLLGDSNKVSSKAISIAAKSGNYYLVNKGLSAGDKIVYAGLDRLRDGVFIQPELLSTDSLLQTNPIVKK